MCSVRGDLGKLVGVACLPRWGPLTTLGEPPAGRQGVWSQRRRMGLEMGLNLFPTHSRGFRFFLSARERVRVCV